MSKVTKSYIALIFSNLQRRVHICVFFYSDWFQMLGVRKRKSYKINTGVVSTLIMEDKSLFKHVFEVLNMFFSFSHTHFIMMP